MNHSDSELNEFYENSDSESENNNDDGAVLLLWISILFTKIPFDILFNFSR